MDDPTVAAPAGEADLLAGLPVADEPLAELQEALTNSPEPSSPMSYDEGAYAEFSPPAPSPAQEEQPPTLPDVVPVPAE
jgi:hypothetical protein